MSKPDFLISEPCERCGTTTRADAVCESCETCKPCGMHTNECTCCGICGASECLDNGNPYNHD